MTALESVDERCDSFWKTLAGMRKHSQGHHGWTVFYDALNHLAHASDDSLIRMLRACWHARPDLSAAHAITLLGLAVNGVVAREQHGRAVFNEDESVADRAALLQGLVAAFEPEIADVLVRRSNSFTAARRFVVPQIIVGHFATFHRIRQVRLLDLGTGLGILPRQLNHRAQYERFASGLQWQAIPLGYTDIPLACRHGVDRPPLPTLEWVRACYGPSAYYEQRFRELLLTLDELEAADVEAHLWPLNILDNEQLSKCIRGGAYNVVTCSFVLYQYSREVRAQVTRTVVEALAGPGLFVSMEPSSALAHPGCRVTAYLAGSMRPFHVAYVSDGHFVGRVLPERDHDEFVVTQLSRTGL